MRKGVVVADNQFVSDFLKTGIERLAKSDLELQVSEDPWNALEYMGYGDISFLVMDAGVAESERLVATAEDFGAYILVLADNIYLAKTNLVKKDRRIEFFLKPNDSYRILTRLNHIYNNLL